MIAPEHLLNALTNIGVSAFFGVPDSLLKDFCSFITDHVSDRRHIIAANEGNAVGLAAGHYLATGTPALVYMQNSGQGNAVNPLTSLADPAVYGIPMLLLIGWRGEPGVHDEPQHRKQGEVTLPLLVALGIPYAVLPDTDPAMDEEVKRAGESMRQRGGPYALVVRKGTCAPYVLQRDITTVLGMRREDAIRTIVRCLQDRDVVVATTGMTSRELFEYRVATGDGHHRDFLTVGSMGHASQIALGIALAKPDRRVCCIDGDGAVLMHLGALAVIGARRPENFMHMVINNGAHDSVGGQPTAGFAVDLVGIARACGYAMVRTCDSVSDIRAFLTECSANCGPSFLEIRVNKGGRADLGRPTSSPRENKTMFMEFLGSSV